jgi:hypothetical protein
LTAATSAGSWNVSPADFPPLKKAGYRAMSMYPENDRMSRPRVALFLFLACSSHEIAQRERAGFDYVATVQIEQPG